MTGRFRLPPLRTPPSRAAVLALGLSLAWGASACAAPPDRGSAAARPDDAGAAAPVSDQGSAGQAPGSCYGSGETVAARDAVAAWIAARRVQDGLPALEAQPVLCQVAQERAEEVARAGTVNSTSSTVSRVSRRLLSSGYAAHLWAERALLGFRKPADMVRVWSETSGSGESSFRRTILGDFEQLGVGVAPGDGGTAVVLLFATPRSSWLRQQVRPLEDLASVRREALERVNLARREDGKAPVTIDPDLDRAAQAHADDMVERGYYGHVSPQGVGPQDFVQATGYPPYAFLAENIAKGLYTPTEAVERWLDSPHHRENILDRRSVQTGLGVAWGEVDGELDVVWVQLFGKPR